VAFWPWLGNFAVVVFLMSLQAHAETLKPFTSDGCSAFPDGTSEQQELWLTCCRNHDYDYWKGGSYQERLDSDKELEKCVSEVGEPEIALLMLAGVRVGGSPFFPTAFRWGYGWSYPRFYGSLTEEELEQIRDSSRQSASPENPEGSTD